MSLPSLLTLTTRACLGAALAATMLVASGCGKKPAPAPLKPTTNSVASVSKTNAPAATATNAVMDETISYFDDRIPPPRARDPFFPASHRRDIIFNPPEAKPVVPVGPPKPPPATLLCSSIVISPSLRIAVINGKQFTPGDSYVVTGLNGTKVTVTCKEINARSAIVQIEGEPGTKELFLKQTP